MIGMWKVMPALAAGCSIVIKPSETTPLTLLRVAELASEAGIPDGVFNVVTGSGAVCGAALTSHPHIAKVSFTGSTATGKQIARAAADTLTGVTTELGGKNPAIVLRMRTRMGDRRTDDRQLPEPGAGVRGELAHLH